MTKADEIMELVERHRVSGGHQEHRATQDTLRTAIEQLAKDAERYRWIRYNQSIEWDGSGLDSVIDSEMEKSK